MVTRCQPSSYSPRITRLRRRPQHTHAAHQVPVRPAQVITGSRSRPAATNHQAIRRNSKAPGLRPVVMMREQARRRVVRGAVGLPIIAHRPEHHSAMPKVVRPPRRMGMPINACACMAPARRALCTSARQGSYQRGQIADYFACVGPQVVGLPGCRSSGHGVGRGGQIDLSGGPISEADTVGQDGRLPSPPLPAFFPKSPLGHGTRPRPVRSGASRSST
jgi:hypothetical protein